MEFIDEGIRVRMTVTKGKAGGKEDKRFIGVEFALALDKDICKTMPQNLKDEWQAIKSVATGISSIEFAKGIDSQKIKLYRLPQAHTEAVDLEMTNVDLENIRLERTLAKDVILYFSVKHPMTRSAWVWLWYAFNRDVYAEFQECQTELIPKDQQNKPAN